MPTYEYTCVTCGHEFDAVRTMSEHLTAPCPECGGQGEQCIRTTPGFALKGGDWPGKQIKGYSTRRVK